MSWQDQLERLDAELAQGRITAEEHRKQRDELLAQASSGASLTVRRAKQGDANQGGVHQGGVHQGGVHQGEANTGWQAVNPARGAQAGQRPMPRAPAEQQPVQAQPPRDQPSEDQPPQDQSLPEQPPQDQPQDGEQAQVDEQVQAGRAPDVRSRPHTPEQTGQQHPPREWPTVEAGEWPTEDDTASVPDEPQAGSPATGEPVPAPVESPHDSEQVTTPVSAPAAPKKRTDPALLQKPIENPYADPPTNPSLPVPPLHQTPVLQPAPAVPAAELPDAAGDGGDQGAQRRGRIDRWLLSGVGLLVVLALIAAGVWLTGTPAGNSDNAAGQVAGSTSKTPSSPPDDPTSRLARKLPELPGVASDKNSAVSVAKGRELTLYTEPEAEALRRNGARTVVYRGSAKDGIGYAILVAMTDDRVQAGKTADALRQELTAAGFDNGPDLREHPKLQVLQRKNERANTYRVVYRSGSYAVRIGLAQMPPRNEPTLRKEFRSTVRDVVQALPIG